MNLSGKIKSTLSHWSAFKVFPIQFNCNVSVATKIALMSVCSLFEILSCDSSCMYMEQEKNSLCLSSLTWIHILGCPFWTHINRLMLLVLKPSGQLDFELLDSWTISLVFHPVIGLLLTWMIAEPPPVLSTQKDLLNKLSKNSYCEVCKWNCYWTDFQQRWICVKDGGRGACWLA